MKLGTGYPDIDPNTAPCVQTEVNAFARYFGPVIFSLVFVVGLVGNSLVLVILGQSRRSWRFADHYLFQLAVADFLLGLTLPFRAVQFTQGWNFGEFFCKLVGGLSTMTTYTSIFLLTYISAERYFVMVRAMPPNFFLKVSHIYVTSAFFWGIGLAFSIVDLHFRTAAYVSQAKAVVCHLGFEAQEAGAWKLGLQLFFFFLGFWLPILVMIYCYGRIFTKLHHAGLLSRRLPLRLLVAIWILFVVCWGPFHCFILMDSLQRVGHLQRDCRQEKLLDFGVLISRSLGLAHCCLNPLVYTFGGVRFQRELCRLFCYSHRRSSGRHHSGSQDCSQAAEQSAIQNMDYSIMM
ncbi:C-X-C chemokine receptor type 3-2-like [Python bivittatus]|uniref:C-X-C chemokine receptor type 3-2-like n=1 Tax=Python bivittatus TaxID=176946 RepID=A0A9F5IN73_PYTBI|nr:C-X-C chemokine receptor type 3-2-like [Python bivittatus]